MGGSSSIDDINRQIDDGFNKTINQIRDGSNKIKDDAINDIRNNISNLRTETQKNMTYVKDTLISDFNKATDKIKTETENKLINSVQSKLNEVQNKINQGNDMFNSGFDQLSINTLNLINKSKQELSVITEKSKSTLTDQSNIIKNGFIDQQNAIVKLSEQSKSSLIDQSIEICVHSYLLSY